MKKILIVLMVSGIISCTNIQTFDLVEFDSKMASWKALDIDAYLFTAQSYTSYCTTIPITVTVLPDMEPELTYEQEIIDNSDYINEISRGYPFTPFKGSTIDALFDSIRKDILNSPKGSIFSIQYNKDFYYPDFFYSSFGGKGGQIALEIKYFKNLQGSGKEE